MIYRKGSVDYQVNMESLHEMEEIVPMTASERSKLRSWAKSGHDVDSNPWNYFSEFGTEMNFLQALRIVSGVSHGPWDDWEYDIPYKWDPSHKHLFSL